nr:hypothetical protein [Bacteroidota bacterium]
MKIAIPTNDWKTISTHLCYNIGFAIFDLEGSKIKSQEFRTNRSSAQVKGLNNTLHKSDRYAITLNILKDCDVVILFVSDEPLITDLTKKEIEIVFTDEIYVGNVLNSYLRKNSEIF